MIARTYLRRIFLCFCVGLIAGLSSTILLYSLEWVWRFQNQHHETIFLLPILGFLLTYLFQRFASSFADSGRLIIEEIHDPKRVLPVMIAPFIFIGTLLSHFAGASTGREGTAVQMAASLTDQLSRVFQVEPSERKMLLVAGAGAGFGVAVGAPIAGVFFGMEMIFLGRLRIFALGECLVASAVAFGVGLLLRAPHTHYPRLGAIDFHLLDFLWVILAGALFGLTARAFVFTHHLLHKGLKKLPLALTWRNLYGGILLCALFYLEGTYHYTSLGLTEIQNALGVKVSFSMPLLKFGFTILSVGFGMKGGEFVPLVFIGTHLGSALSEWIPMASTVLAAIGFSAVFGGAANVPITCAILSCEIFGWHLAPYALIGCLVSYYFSGEVGIYNGQVKSAHHKLSALREWWMILRRREL